MRRILIVLTVLLGGLFLGPGAAAGDRFWVGGGIGLAFGDVDWVEVAPLVGYRFTDRVTFGGGLLYRYRKDGRLPGNPSANDYGFNVFARYRLTPWLFVHGEYEYLDYEFIRSDLSTERETFNSILAGPGFARPLGKRASFYALALYNFSYDDDDLRSPYDDEWVWRFGVSVGF